MKNKLVYVVLVALLALSCEDNEGNLVGPPRWEGGVPATTVGATSVDVALNTDRDANVYYVLSQQELNLSAEELVARTGNADDTTPGTGVVAVSRTENKIVTIDRLRDRSAYNLYLIAESADGARGDEITKISFRTQVRQDTGQYQSAAENRTVQYLIYKPEEVFKKPDQRYPVAIYLGGFGEKARDDESINLIQNGLLPEYIHKGNDVPFMVVSLQHVRDAWNMDLIHEGIRHVLSTYPADPARVYLLGSSGGAAATWSYAALHPEMLAAIVPVSGWSEAETACALKNVAVWAFHNEVDDLVHSGKTVTMVNAINECRPAVPAQVTLFPGRGHDAWRRVFDPGHPDWQRTPNMERFDLYGWLIEQRKR